MTDREHVAQMVRSESEEERLQGVKLLARQEPPDGLDLLYEALGDGSWRVRKEAAELFLSLPRAGELAGEIVELLHAQDNAGLRNTAVEILVSLGRRAIPFLLEEVNCADPDVRKFVLDILGEIGDNAALDALVKALGDPDNNVRAAAAENLGKLGASDAIPALLESLEEADLLFRFTVLQALGQIGAEVPAERLLAFKDDNLLRKALFDCLGHVGGAESLTVLLEGLLDPLRNVREAAAVALVRVGDRYPGILDEIIAGKDREETTLAIAELLESSQPDVCRAAITLAGCLGNGRYARRLLEMLDNEELRESAAATLMGLARGSRCALTEIWPDTQGRPRAYLAYIFGEAGCEAAVPRLQGGILDGNEEVRASCARALGQVGGGEAIPLLAERLKDECGEVRQAALQALTQLCPAHPAIAQKVFRPFLDHPQPEQRMYAACVLGTLAGEEIENALVLLVKDESGRVRQAAIRALGGRMSPRILSTLRLTLTDEDTDVRQMAVELLGDSGNAEAVSALASALQDEDLWVRTAAVRALGRIATPDAADLVKQAMGDPVGLVQITALEVLSELDPRAASTHLERALEHSDEEVVSAALKLLSRADSDGWLSRHETHLLNHPHWEVRLTFARTLAEKKGAASQGVLGSRLLVEGEELVRQSLRELLEVLAERQA